MANQRDELMTVEQILDQVYLASFAGRKSDNVSLIYIGLNGQVTKQILAPRASST